MSVPETTISTDPQDADIIGGYESWRRSRTEGRGRRLLTLFTVGALGAVTIAALFYSLFQPFSNPDVHLVVLSAPSDVENIAVDGELALPQYSRNDQAAFAALAHDIHQYTPDHTAPRIDLPTPSDWNTLGGRLATRGAGDGHVFLIYLSATGISVNGTAFLEFPAAVPGDPPYRLRLQELLEQICASKARVKLLLLDAQSREFDVKSPLVVNEFPRLLRETVAATDDPSLWVLNSHSDLERSHVSPAKRRSFFSLAVVQGLRGNADQDANGTIDVIELRRFVAETVFAQVQQLTGHYETQTPMLCWGGGRPSSRNAADVLPVSALPKSEAATEPEKPAALFPATLTVETARQFQPPIDASVFRPRALPELPRVLESLRQPLESRTDLPSAPIIATQQLAGDGAAQSNAAAPKTQPAENTIPKSSPANIPDRLIAAWAMRDRFIDHNSRMATPIGRMPHVWRQLENRLLNCELRYRQLGPIIPKKEKPDPNAAPQPPSPRELAANRISDDLDAVIRLLQVAGEARRQTQPPVTPLEQAVDRSLAAMQRFPADLPSLGMAEWCHFCCESCLGTELRSAIREFDRILATGTRPQLEAWLAKRPSEQQHFVEVRLAISLSRTPHLSWNEIRIALAARRYAEQIVAAAHDEWKWIAGDVKAADEALIDAERQLHDGLGDDYARRANRQLAFALQKYQQVADRVQLLRAARALATELQYHAGDLVRWKQSVDSGPRNVGPSATQLTHLFQMLKELNEKLNGAGNPDELETIRRLAATLAAIKSDWRKHLRNGVRAISQRLTEGRKPLPGDLERIESALGTSLLEASTRLAALQALDQLLQATDAAGLPRLSQVAEGRIVGRADWERLLQRAELNVSLAKLLVAETNDSELDRTRAEMANLARLTRNDVTRTNQLWLAHRQLANALGRFYAEQQRKITEYAEQVSPSKDNRELTANLNAARVLAGVQRSVEKSDLLLRLHSRFRLQLAFKQQSQRVLAALSDAPVWQREGLQQSYGQLRKESPGSRIPAITPPAIRIDAASALSLVESSVGELRFTLHNQRTQPMHLRVIAEFDGDLLDAQALSTQIQRLVRGDRHTERSAASDFSLPTNKPLELTLRINRRNKTVPWPTHVILHVRTAETVYRRTVAVHLPSPKSVELHVAGGTNGRSIIADVQNRKTLQPFPNRTTPCRFRLRSLLKNDRAVDVQLLAAEQPLPDISMAEFSARDFQRWSDRLGSLKELASHKNLALPADGSWADIKFQSPATKPPSKKQPAQLQDIAHGLLILVRDRTTGSVSFRPFTVAIQRPRRFLQANASFNLETRRLEIRIAAKGVGVLPEGPVKVRCDFSPQLPAGLPGKLAGEIKADAMELRLFADIPTTLGRTIRADVHVDGFPRAFVFRVPTDRTAAMIAEDTGRRGITISIDPSNAIASETKAVVPVTVRVDSPVGSFENGLDAIAVGVDSNRNRVFDGDTFLALKSDRDAKIGVESIGENGEVLIRTRVTDWNRDVDLSRFADRRVNLLGRLTVNNTTTWSDYVTVIMDAQPPVIEPLRSLTSVEGGTIKVPISANDFGLSGVAVVEAAIDLVGLGQLQKDPQPTVAIPGPQGQWIATLTLDKLVPGTYPVLVRATDRAGNVSRVVKTQLAVLSKAQAAELAKPRPNRIAGIVMFDGDPIPEATVTLFPLAAKAAPKKRPAAKTAAAVEIPPVATDEKGRFLFPQVPPGNYEIVAKKLAVANKNRAGKVKVKVPAVPQATPLQQIELH